MMPGEAWERRSGWVVAVVLAAALALPGAALAKGGHKPTPRRTAIVLVTFGTSVPEAQKVYGLIDRAVKLAFPKVDVFWAFTAAKIRRKLAKRGKVTDSPQTVLARLMDRGYTHVALQSLHVIPGAEFHDLVAVVRGFRMMRKGRFAKLVIGEPLCATTADLRVVAAALLADLPRGRKKNEAVIFMGHGTHHPADAVYPAMAYILGQSDPLVLMGTVEGFPSLEDLLPRLKAGRVKRAWLIPFMTVAGDHARNDMAGGENDSWKSVLARNGIAAVPVLRPITENPAVLKVFLAHLTRALKKLH